MRLRAARPRILTIERFLEEDFCCCKPRAEQARATEQQQLKAPSRDRASAPHGDGKARAASGSECFDGTASMSNIAGPASLPVRCGGYEAGTRFLSCFSSRKRETKPTSNPAAACAWCLVQQCKRVYPTLPCYHQGVTPLSWLAGSCHKNTGRCSPVPSTQSTAALEATAVPSLQQLALPQLPQRPQPLCIALNEAVQQRHQWHGGGMPAGVRINQAPQRRKVQHLREHEHWMDGCRM